MSLLLGRNEPGDAHRVGLRLGHRPLTLFSGAKNDQPQRRSYGENDEEKQAEAQAGEDVRQTSTVHCRSLPYRCLFDSS